MKEQEFYNMNEILENSVELAESFLLDEVTEDQVYSAFYQGLADQEIFDAALVEFVESLEDEDEYHVDGDEGFDDENLEELDTASLIASGKALGLKGLTAGKAAGAAAHAKLGTAGLAAAGSGLAAHLATYPLGKAIHNSHLKELRHKLKKAGVSDNQIAKTGHKISNYLTAQEVSDKVQRRKNAWRAAGKAYNAVAGLGVKGLVDHYKYKKSLRDLKEKLHQAGVSHDKLNSIKEFRKLK